MYQVVIDTNVLVAALRSSLGASYRLLDTLEMGQWQPNISVAVALEYEEVLKRSTVNPGMSLQDVDDFMDYLLSRANLVPIFFRWRPALRDPDDDRILEVAVRSKAMVVTFNHRDFEGAEQFGVHVMSPAEFLAMLGGPG